MIDFDQAPTSATMRFRAILLGAFCVLTGLVDAAAGTVAYTVNSDGAQNIDRLLALELESGEFEDIGSA